MVIPEGKPRRVRVLRLQLMSSYEDACVEKENVEYRLEKMKLLNIQIATQKFQREVRLAEEALPASYAAEPTMTRFWSWRVPMIKERLRLLHEEREPTAEVVRKMEAIRDDSEERVKEEEQGDAASAAVAPPQQSRV